MKKILLILISLFLVISVSGCGVDTKEKTKNIDVTLSSEEKYSRALTNLETSDYVYVEVDESIGKYYSSISEMKYTVDRENKLMSLVLTASKYKYDEDTTYREEKITVNELSIGYNDYNSMRSFGYDTQCGKGWLYNDLKVGTHTEVDGNAVKILMLTKDMTATSIVDNVYTFEVPREKIAEAWGSLFNIADANVSLMVTLDDENKVEKFVYEYVFNEYSEHKKMVTFESYKDQTIVLPETAKNAKINDIGQSCN